MDDEVTIRYSWEEGETLRLKMEFSGKTEEVAVTALQLVEGTTPHVQLAPKPFSLATARLRELEITQPYVYLKLQEPEGRCAEVEILRQGVNALVYVNRQLIYTFKPPA